MTKPLASLLLLLLLSLLLPFAGPATAEDPPEEGEVELDLGIRVNDAIDKGVAWLKEAQKKDGSWGPCVANARYDGKPLDDPNCYFTGPTSFSIFTLAKCGVSRKHKVVKRGLKWLRDKARRGTTYKYTSYESSSVILMLTALYDTGENLEAGSSPTSPPRGSKFKSDDWKWMHERIGHLIGGAKSEKGCQMQSGGWGYVPEQNHADVSATQFALLALREASRAGYPFGENRAAVWSRAADYLRFMQKQSGGFPYTKKEEGWSVGMTAAALSSLLIVKEQMGLLGQELPDWFDPMVASAFDLLGKQYSPMSNKTEFSSMPPLYHFCALYAVERVGSLARKQLLGGHPWYVPGAEYFLAAQKKDGRWRDSTCMAPRDVLGTCFTLLFLKRATMPMAVTTGSD